MKPIEFVGVRGGHGCTTVAIAAATFTGGLDLLKAHNLEDAQALAGTTILGPSEVFVMDSGIVPNSQWNTRRIAVLRGPDYLGAKTLLERREQFDGMVMVQEPGRSLMPSDMESMTGLQVVAVVDYTPSVARTIDAGLFLQKLPRLEEFAGLRSWIESL